MRTKLDSRYTQPARVECGSMKDIGQAFRLRRKELQLSQTQLAQMVPCGQKLISEIENGKETVAAGTVLRIANGLGIDVVLSVRGK